MRVFLLLALVFPLNATAGTRLDKWTGGVKSLDMAGPVDVPLLSGRLGSAIPYIQVRFSEEDEVPYLFQIDLGSDRMVLSSSVAKDLGLKIKTHNKKPIASLGTDDGEEKYRLGGKWRTTHADEIILADGLVIKGVDFRVGGAELSEEQTNDDLLLVSPVAGVIGVGALPVAAAILPEKGVVRFVPADQGAQLLAEVGGDAIPFTSLDSEFIKHPLMGKLYFSPAKVVVNVDVSGQQLPMRLNTEDYGTLIDETWQPGDAAVIRHADYDIYYVDLKLGAQDLGGTWAAHTNTNLLIRDGEHGILDYSLLRDYNLAVDYASSQLALAPAASLARQSSKSLFIEAWQKKIEKLQAEPPEDPDEAEGHAKKIAEAQMELGSLYRENGHYDKAADLMEVAVEVEPDLCEYWLNLSWSEYLAGEDEDAISAARKALDLYVGWAELPKEDREKIQKMKEDELKEVATKPQDLDACYSAAGVLAELELARDGYDTIHETYKLYDDLHPLLPKVEGLALIREGKLEQAEGPLRQAVKKAIVNDHWWYRLSSRSGLAHVFLETDRPEQALAIWEQEANSYVGQYLGMNLYADIIEAMKGADAVRGALEEMNERYPDNPAVQTRLAIEWVHAGDLDKAKGYLLQAREKIEEEIAIQPEWSALRASLAYNLYWAGDLEGAAKTAHKALEEDSFQAFSHYVLALVAAAQGDMALAKEHRMAMERCAAGNILYYRVPPLAPPSLDEEEGEAAPVE